MPKNVFETSNPIDHIILNSPELDGMVKKVNEQCEAISESYKGKIISESCENDECDDFDDSNEEIDSILGDDGGTSAEFEILDDNDASQDFNNDPASEDAADYIQAEADILRGDNLEAMIDNMIDADSF